MMMNTAIELFDSAQQWLFETLVQPMLFNLGLSGFIEDAYDGTMWLLIGVLQIALIVVVFGTLQRLRPVEPLVDRHQVRIDILYTLIHRLGLFRVALFFPFSPFGMPCRGRRACQVSRLSTLISCGRVSPISPGSVSSCTC